MVWYHFFLILKEGTIRQSIGPSVCRFVHQLYVALYSASSDIRRRQFEASEHSEVKQSIWRRRESATLARCLTLRRCPDVVDTDGSARRRRIARGRERRRRRRRIAARLHRVAVWRPRRRANKTPRRPGWLGGEKGDE